MSSSVTGRWSSGSITWLRASRTASRLGISRESTEGLSGELREGLCGRCQRARVLEHRREEIAVLRAPFQRDLHREVARLDSLAQLVPVERRRDGRAAL